MSETVPAGWVATKLGKLGKFSKGKGISKSETVSTGLPCIRYAEIYTIHDLIIKKFHSFISQDTVKTTKKLSRNDIIFAGSGETVEDIGKSVAFVSDHDAYVGGDSIIFSPTGALDSVFISYELNDEIRRKQLRKLGQGSSVIHIYASALDDLNIVLPPLPEQKKIASILTSVDEVIENTQRQIDKLQELKKATMNELLTKGIGHTEFKDSELGRIPKSWEVKPLSEVADLKVGFAFKSTWFEEVGCRLLRGENVGYGKAVWKETKCLDDSKVSLFSEYLLSCGDIIIGMDRTFTKSGAKISRISEIDLPCLLVQRVGKFFFSALNQDFMWHILRSDLYLLQLSVQEKGMDIPHLSKREILQPLIPILPLPEQKIVSDGLSGFDEQISNLSRKLAQTQSLKKSLMQDLLTGKVRVQV